MADRDRVNDAIEQGRRQAERVLEYRRSRRSLRQAALAERGAEAFAPPVRAEVGAELLAALGPASDRVLVAEGDSWFYYPFTDVLKELEDRHGFDVESVSHWGDTIEEMAYSEGQPDDFARKIEKLIRNGRTPEAVLLSGGGNDLEANKAVIEDLIDRFNTMLADLPSVPGMGHVQVLDVRPALRNDSDVYEDWWANELHPTGQGFRAVAQMFADALGP
jgi:hypothetical protein